MPSELNTWDLDLKQYEGSTQAQASIVFCIFEQHNLLKHFNIQEEKFLSLILKLSTLYEYQRNPFHNFSHALAVLHGCHVLFGTTDFRNRLDMLSLPALYVSALRHDVDHSGNNNAFENKT